MDRTAQHHSGGFPQTSKEIRHGGYWDVLASHRDCSAPAISGAHLMGLFHLIEMSDLIPGRADFNFGGPVVVGVVVVIVVAASASRQTIQDQS